MHTSIAWEDYLRTDLSNGWGGNRTEPPLEAGPDDWSRWERVREAVRIGTDLRLPVDLVRRIQQRIRPDGCMTSQAGEFDPMSAIAIMWYQHDRELAVSGLLDEATVAAMAREWPEVRETSVRRLLPCRLLIDDFHGRLERMLYYRRAILDNGGVFDAGSHRPNLLVLENASVSMGGAGSVLRYTGSQRSWVTVCLWVVRDPNDDVIDVVVWERPGCVRPTPIRPGTRLQGLVGGQLLCDLEVGTPLADAQALIPRVPSGPGAMLPEVPELPVEPGSPLASPTPVEPRRLGYDGLHQDLLETREVHGDERRCIPVMRLHASRLDPL